MNEHQSIMSHVIAQLVFQPLIKQCHETLHLPQKSHSVSMNCNSININTNPIPNSHSTPKLKSCQPWLLTLYLICPCYTSYMKLL